MKELPPPWPLRKLIGPSFIILGVGLGSGELILWPYLAANFGLGIIWAAVVGITMQFFINMEIERYTLVTGESVFMGMTRKYGRWIPVWFLLTTLIPWMWPGIIASAASVLAASVGAEYSKWWGISLLLIVGVLFNLGSIVYKTQERIQKVIIFVGVPFILGVTLWLAKSQDWGALFAGLVGRGAGYTWLPQGLPMATFLAALAYAGAGGNLNLAQSLYIKEKGYGMGKYSGRITNVLEDEQEKTTLTGESFENTPENLLRFRKWWVSINIEHGIVFWATGVITMLLLSLLAYATVYKHPAVETSINFVLLESVEIGQRGGYALGVLFLLLVGVMLFGTQFSVFGSNARIAGENLAILVKRGIHRHLHRLFYGFLWVQVLVGVIIFSLGFTEPLELVIIGAVMNALSMFVYTGLILWMNMTALSKPLRPALWRVVAVLGAFSFYGVFSVLTVIKYL
ncbi:MAG: Nramp family divalent metal transporter [bacterium]|nr:Nramp family divalent metal transporter [bacterium]